jgi:dihydrofolate reductase
MEFSMTSGHIMMAMSLDGFVARSDHNLDWLNKQSTDGEDHGFTEFLESVDVIVMGSGSLRTVLGFDQWVYTKPVIVLSHSMSDADIPDHLKGKVEISSESPPDLIERLNGLGYSRVYVDGGAIIRSFLKLDFIKSMKITIIPILIGEGIRMFGELDRDIDLKLENVQKTPSGLVTLDYSLIEGSD